MKGNIFKTFSTITIEARNKSYKNDEDFFIEKGGGNFCEFDLLPFEFIQIYFI